MEQAFENLPSEELFRIPQERRNASFTASRPTLGLERIEQDQPDIDLTRPFTLSPYPNDGQLYRAYANKEDERAARWLLFFFSTYLHEGHIRFRRLNDTTFEVLVRFHPEDQ